MATTQIHGNKQIQPGTIKDANIDVAAAILTPKLAEGPDFIKRTGAVVFTADQPHGTSDTVSASNFKITRLADPTNAQDAATRSWVLSQFAAQAGTTAATAKAATTANITLSATQTVDGVALSVNDVCLVKNQTTTNQNGLYTVASSAWTRAPGMDTWAEVPGVICSVQQGTVNADTLWLSTADAGGTLNTTAITWVQMPGPSDIIAGLGMTRTGQTIDIVTADTSLTVNADNIQVRLDSARAITVGGAGIGVNVDNTTIDIATNQVRVKPGSIGDTQLSTTYQKQANIVIRETPSGTINSSNATFTLAATPVAGTEQIFYNGVLQESGAGNDYTISGATITMLTPPDTGGRLKACYFK